MNRRYVTIITRIEQELIDLQQVIQRIKEAWEKAKHTNDDLYLDSVALNLHGFYAGLERIFELIAGEIDGSVPEGKTWHQDLLKQMTLELKQVRPAVISRQSMNALDEYRGFRHVVRNIYTFDLSPTRLAPLVDGISDTFGKIESELKQFIAFVQRQTDLAE